MAKYCIVAASPKDEINHLNSKFKMCEFLAKDDEWVSIGWKSIDYVTELLKAGHSVQTAKLNGNSLTLGSPVEIELRINKNNSNYKISDMPDK